MGFPVGKVRKRKDELGMKKRWMITTAILLAMALSAGSLAAEPATADEGSVYIAKETLLTNEGGSTYWSLADSGYVVESIYTEAGTDEYYLRDAAGQRVNKDAFQGIQILSYTNYKTDLFAVTKDMNTLNSW